MVLDKIVDGFARVTVSRLAMKYRFDMGFGGSLFPVFEDGRVVDFSRGVIDIMKAELDEPRIGRFGRQRLITA